MGVSVQLATPIYCKFVHDDSTLTLIFIIYRKLGQREWGGAIAKFLSVEKIFDLETFYIIEVGFGSVYSTRGGPFSLLCTEKRHKTEVSSVHTGETPLRGT